MQRQRLRSLRDPHLSFLGTMTNARSLSDLKERSFSESECHKVRPRPKRGERVIVVVR